MSIGSVLILWQLDAIDFNGWNAIASLEPAKSNSFSDLRKMFVHLHSNSKLCSLSDSLYQSAKTMHVGMFCSDWSCTLFMFIFVKLFVCVFLLFKSMHSHIAKNMPMVV